jgi:glyoxylase-like metal-dependent hydrolase (beta-lactamase superfamily II)
MFKIDLMPAAQGDCVWIEYGPPDVPHRVLIDGGTAPTYDHLRARIRQLPEDKRRFDVLIVTHVDADHIEGIIRLLQDDSLGLRFDDIWFNGWKHLPTDRLGPAQGEMLSVLLGRRARPGRPRLPWNRAFQARQSR